MIILQYILAVLITYLSIFSITDRICKCIEKCSLYKNIRKKSTKYTFNNDNTSEDETVEEWPEWASKYMGDPYTNDKK